MHVIRLFLIALRSPRTYNLTRNPEACFGFLWGLPIPVFSLLLDTSLTDSSVKDALSRHPWHLLFAAHPILFAIIFGAMGSIRQNLEAQTREFIGRLETQAVTDPLTGIHNRRFVIASLQEALARCARHHEPLSVVMFDMDRFKAVNDTLGHLAGDRLLRDVAASLQRATRQSDVLGRYGGDEFLLVAFADGAAARDLAERARAEVVRATGYTVTAGVGAYPADGTTAAALIAAADAALGDSKRRRSEPLTRDARPTPETSP
jgi:diguanylate cyclase (GGDEF)-like protein